MRKMCKKIAVMAGLMTLVTALLTPMVAADGWHPSDEYLHLYEPYQKAVIYWNGYTEIMILSSAVRSKNLTNIAWVVPIISTTKPNVTAGNMTVFEELVEYFKPSYWWDYPFKTYHNGRDYYQNVTVIEIKEVDIYDVIIISATNASDLIDWLVENNLQVPEEAYDVIDRYVQMDNCYFVINKLDLKNRFKDVIEQLENGSVPDNLDEYRRIIDDLGRGMATPLKFTFTPPYLYYPLSISSLNAGRGKIEVYVLAEKPVADKNQVLQVDKCKIVTEELKEKIKEFIPTEEAEYVTRLSYYGLLQELTDDAVFEFFTVSNPYNPMFFYFNSDLENLTGSSTIDAMTWDPDGEILELQYRIDKTGPWMLAERSDISYYYESYWIFKKYGMPIYGTNGALWSIEVATENLTDGNHTLELRVLRKTGSSMSYAPVLTQSFTTNNSDEHGDVSNKNTNTKFAAILLPILIMISMFGVAVISRKTTLPQ